MLNRVLRCFNETEEQRNSTTLKLGSVDFPEAEAEASVKVSFNDFYIMKVSKCVTDVLLLSKKKEERGEGTSLIETRETFQAYLTLPYFKVYSTAAL